MILLLWLLLFASPDMYAKGVKELSAAGNGRQLRAGWSSAYDIHLILFTTPTCYVLLPCFFSVAQTCTAHAPDRGTETQ